MKTKIHKKLSFIFMMLLGVILFTGCSSGSSFQEGEMDVYDKDDDGKRTFSFYEDDVHWKVKFDNDKIVEIFKDGVKIPDKEIPVYEDFVYEKVDEFKEGMKAFHSNMADFKIDMKEFNEHMAQMKQELQNAKFEINLDDEQFKRDMKKLSAEIRDNFNSDEFKEQMQKLKEELQNLKIDIDMDEVHDQLRKAREQMKNIKVDVNMDELREELRHAKEELKKINFSEVSEQMDKAKKQLDDAKFELKEAKKTLRKYNSFMHDFREELEKDKLIENAGDDFDMEFNSRELIINGKKAPAELHKKYQSMYEKHFDKKMNDDVNIKMEK